MKKCKLLVVGLIALLMAGGLVLAGCDEDTAAKLVKCPKGGECKPASSFSGKVSCGKDSCDVEKINSQTCNCPS